MNLKIDKYKDIAILSIVPIILVLLILASFSLEHWKIGPYFINATLAIVATIFGGFQRFISGFKDLFKLKITVNVFVVVALIATMVIGEFRPAAIIVFIMAVAGAFESYVLDRTKKNIRNLLDLAPKTAIIRKNKEEFVVPVSELVVGDIVVVKPGARIPVDGVVVSGESSVNQAPITGEYMPVDKLPGNLVWSGTLNESGQLDIRTEKVGAETTLAKIVRLVQDAQNTRAPIQNIADRFTAWFLPTVIVLAITAYFLSKDIKTAVAVLLVACPCAFAIATPTAVTAGISWLARRAVLIKGGIFLEIGHKINYLLIDKTGTLTFGKTKLTQIITFNDYSEEEVLKIACIAEQHSEHPLARSILDAGKERKLITPNSEHFMSTSGMGVEAIWDEKKILVGKASLLNNAGISLDPPIELEVAQQSGQGRTSVLVTLDNKIIGLLAITDKIRPEIAQTIRQLKMMGVKHVTMLTGDYPQVSKAIAKEIGVDDFKADLLPKQKQDIVRTLQAEGYIVGMVGDGVNDAPALALANVGIAMGITGSDVAIETSNVTLINDHLSGVIDFMLDV
ncbi:Cation-translocating P-type ATPase [Gammaproteobacteria bacterium]